LLGQIATPDTTSVLIKCVCEMGLLTVTVVLVVLVAVY